MNNTPGKIALFCIGLMVLAGCRNIDVIESTTVADSPIEYSVGGVSGLSASGEDTDYTKAYLTTTSNITTNFPLMTVKAVKLCTPPTPDEVLFTDEFEPSGTESRSLTKKWDETSYIFYSYPSGEGITPSFLDNNMTFDYTVALTSTGTNDIVVARKEESKGNKVTFTYKHIFTAVNVVYKSMKLGHTITKIQLKDTKTKGTCRVKSDGTISWSSLSAVGNIVDNTRRYATIDNTTLTEDGCKFMTIPGQPIYLEVTIDGKTVTASCAAKNPGDIVTFYIEDDYSITTKSGMGTDDGITTSTDGKYKISVETYVTGDYVPVGYPKPLDIIMVLDYSGSMKSGSYPLGTTYSKANVTPVTYSNWNSAKTSYKVNFGGTNYTVECNSVAPATGYDNLHWAYINVGTDRYYITLDGGLYKSDNKSPTATNYPVSDDNHIIFPSQGNSKPLFGQVSFSASDPIAKRIDGLKAAVSDFVDEIYAQSVASGKEHRISIIEFQKPAFPSFTSSTSDRAKYIVSTESAYLHQAYAGSEDKMKETTGVLFPFRDVRKPGVVESIKAAITLPYVNDGCTAIDYGMYLASLMMGQRRTEAEPVIVVFTDGKPTHSSGTIASENSIPGYSDTEATRTKSDTQVGDGAVYFSNKCKTAGAKVYSICVCTGSDKPGETFMKNLSSYSTSEPDYYQDASSADLRQVFKEIAYWSARGAIDVHKDAYVSVIISDAFTLPSTYISTAGDVTVYTCDQTGYNTSTHEVTWSSTKTDITSTMTVTYDAVNQNIKIKGFDYGAYPVICDGTGPYTGKKLVMVFDALPPNASRVGTGSNLAIEYSTGFYQKDGSLISMFSPLYVNL